jgi:hypothetical protein
MSLPRIKVKSEEEKALSSLRSMKELHGLNTRQVDLIEHGFFREDVIDLNEDQCLALSWLYMHGLTPAHLLNKTWFEFYHCLALSSLMTKRGKNNMNADEALQEIDHLSFHQAGAIASGGLLRADVLNLNKAQSLALGELHRFGLTREQLHKEWFNDLGHYTGLKHLITQCHMDSAQAMVEIDQLPSHQADAISYGLRRKGVMNLSSIHCTALVKLYPHGLRRDHLEHCAWFDHFHAAALRSLMTRCDDKNLNADDAMTLIALFKDDRSVLLAILDEDFRQKIVNDFIARKKINSMRESMSIRGTFFLTKDKDSGDIVLELTSRARTRNEWERKLAQPLNKMQSIVNPKKMDLLFPNRTNRQVHHYLKKLGYFKDNEALRKESFQKACVETRKQYRAFVRKI